MVLQRHDDIESVTFCVQRSVALYNTHRKRRGRHPFAATDTAVQEQGVALGVAPALCQASLDLFAVRLYALNCCVTQRVRM